jgi:osmotically-inducible protein OsmY
METLSWRASTLVSIRCPKVRMTRTDADIHKDVASEFLWDPSLEHDDVAVSVHDGVVTLAGYTKSYRDKSLAERVASRLKGVRAIVNNIEVRLPSISHRADPDIARAALDALKWNSAVPDEWIRVKVEHGWITLEGKVDWHYQRDAAERTVYNLTGVKGVTNLIAIDAKPAAGDVKAEIKQALERGAQFDADRINVGVTGDKAILTGTVRSYAQWRDAAAAARNAPGIAEVENKIVVDPSVYATA